MTSPSRILRFCARGIFCRMCLPAQNLKPAQKIDYSPIFTHCDHNFIVLMMFLMSDDICSSNLCENTFTLYLHLYIRDLQEKCRWTVMTIAPLLTKIKLTSSVIFKFNYAAMDKFIYKTSSRPSNHEANYTAQQRHAQFKHETYHDGGLLFCKICNIVIMHYLL